MAVDQYDPITGHPIFLDSGAPDVGLDPTEAARFAAEVGTRLIKTTDERQSYPYVRVGLECYDTDIQDVFTYTENGWRRGAGGDTGWVELPLRTGFVAHTSTPRVKRTNGIIGFRGNIKPSSGNFPSSSVAVADIPDWAIPGVSEVPVTLAGPGTETRKGVATTTGILNVIGGNNTVTYLELAPLLYLV